MGTQGDYRQEEFSEEEKAALGEAATPSPADDKAEPQDKGPDTQDEPKGEDKPAGEVKAEPKAEPTAEEMAAAEDQGFTVETDDKGRQYIVDADGTKIPPKRFREVYREAKEGERTKEKFDLFRKLGPGQYYDIYPDEKPEGWTAQPRQEERAAPPPADLGAMIVKHPDGQYDGMTLREVYQIDPVFATNLQTEFIFQQRQEAERARGETDKVRQSAAKEIDTFANDRAKELFDKELTALSKDEEAKVAETIGQVVEWMNKTHRGGGNISDAYWLMNKEGLIKKAADSAAKSTLKDLQSRKGPPSIDTGKGGDIKPTGFEAYEKMTEAQLTDAIDKMHDKDVAKFFKEAPKSLRTKYPGIPWN